MKKEYKKLEAYKVRFDSREQIAVACVIVEENQRYTGAGLIICSGTTQWSPAGANMPACAYPQNTIDLQLRYTV